MTELCTISMELMRLPTFLAEITQSYIQTVIDTRH